MDKNPNQHITTHPDVVEAACMILKDKGCKILIGESVVFGKKDFLFERCGMTEVAKKYGAKLVAFEGQELIECHGDFLKKLFIPKLLKDVDLIISIPKLKTHMFTEYTGAVKNLFGCIPGSKKSEYHVIGHNQRRFAKILYDIWKNVKPGLTMKRLF